MDFDGDNPWTTKSARTAFSNAWFSVEEHDVLTPSGRDGYYGVIRIRRTAIGVLPIDGDGRVHLVGQWRYPLGRYSWEIPEGGAEPDESAEACARRELKEETGLEAATLVEIARLDLSNSLTDESAIVFAAWDLRQGDASPEDTEVLRHAAVPFLDALAWATEGRLTDALTVAALLRAHHMAMTGALPAALAAAMVGPREEKHER